MMMSFINLALLLANLYGGARIIKEYHEILDYKRDERLFADYEKRSVSELEEIIDTGDCGY